MTWPLVLRRPREHWEKDVFFLHMHLRGIPLLIFSCILEMVWNAFRNSANSCPQVLSALSFPSEEMQREGKLLLPSLKVTDTRGLQWITGTAPEHRFQPHISLAAPVGKMGIRLSVLLENNVNICTFSQTDWASNTQKAGEEMRRQKIDSKTSKKESECSLWCSLGQSVACIVVLAWHGWPLNQPYGEHNWLEHHRGSSSTCALEQDAQGVWKPWAPRASLAASTNWGHLKQREGSSTWYCWQIWPLARARISKTSLPVFAFPQ